MISKGAFIPGAGQNNSVYKFALDEKKGSISDPIKVQSGYAVYQIVDKFPEGFYTFEELKVQQLPLLVKQEKKLDFLKTQASDLRSKITGNDINSLKNINSQLNIIRVDTSTVSVPSPVIGSDFDFNSVVYKLQNGQISEPIRTARGYYIVQMRNIGQVDQAKFQQEFESIRAQLISAKKQNIVQEWLADLKEKAVIVDNRDKNVQVVLINYCKLKLL